jgi:glycosyltransferase involved in cell wall biosynthesis
MMPLTLHIIVPVYNEKDNFEELYRSIKKHIHTEHIMYVIYDFDEDNTVPVVKALQPLDERLILVKNLYGAGVLNAIKTGFRSASSGPCLVVMGDLSDDLSIVEKMVEQYRQGFKVVCASRYMAGGKQIGGPLLKRIFSRLAGVSLHYLTGIPTHDVTNNFKLYDQSFLNTITIESTGGFEIAMELTVKAFRNGYPICEIPAIWRDRTAGTSRFKILKWTPHYLRWYLYTFMPRPSSA